MFRIDPKEHQNEGYSVSQPSVEEILEYLRESAGRPLRAEELASALEILPEERSAFDTLLDRLEDDGILYKVKGKRYAAPDKINLVVGRLTTIRSGAGFVVPDEDADDLFIPAQHLGSAVHGDRVVARLEKGRKRRPEGRIIKVLRRSRESVVGIYHPTRNFGFVVPEDRKLTRDFFVPPGAEGEAAEGDVVVANVTFWGDEHRGPAAEITRVLGKLDAPGVDVLAVVHGHELPVEFPGDIEAAAEQIRERGVREEDLGGREDFRDQLVFTIDPEDAKDHDDALSIRPVEEGTWEVGIHIADVSHYVEPGSDIDEEARERGTSIYLVDRVVPMLPEPLSAGICSLRADEDRLALSLLVTLDEEGNVRSRRLARTVIRSRHRLSYEDAQAVLDGDRSISPEVDEALPALRRISRTLRAKRAERGSLDFDLPEGRVVLNRAGEPTDIQRVARLDAHRLVEDFMLLANRTVAARAANAKLPFIYRIHGSPEGDRLEKLRDFLATFGYRLPRGAVGGKDLQRVLDQAEGRPEAKLVSTVILRSMQRAEYSTEELGHFGLAAEHYSHFTSPIRRYADLVVHRLLITAVVEGESISPALRDELPNIARSVSDRERVADEAQRDSIDLKKVEFMERHLGDRFEGTVSGVTSFGFFVLLDRFFVEGLVHVNSLEDDYYIYVEERYALVGERTKRQFQLGSRVHIKVVGVNREERHIDFQVLDSSTAG